MLDISSHLSPSPRPRSSQGIFCRPFVQSLFNYYLLYNLFSPININMRSDIFAFLLFLAPALASPVETASTNSLSYGESSGDGNFGESSTYGANLDNENGITDGNGLNNHESFNFGGAYDQILSEAAAIPTSILTVLATAVPATWYQDILDPASRSSIISDIEAGTLPAWYNELPSSVRAYATSVGAAYMQQLFPTTTDATADSMFHVQDSISTSGFITPIQTGSSWKVSEVARLPSHSIATPAQDSTTTTGTASSSASNSASSSGSSTKSSVSATLVSTGGAPIATGGIMVSVAGAAGILGLAIAL